MALMLSTRTATRACVETLALLSQRQELFVRARGARALSACTVFARPARTTTTTWLLRGRRTLQLWRRRILLPARHLLQIQPKPRAVLRQLLSPLDGRAASTLPVLNSLLFRE